MILLAALAGLRAHEIAKMRGDDVDLDRSQLWVEGKGGVRDVVPLHPMLATLARSFPRRGYWFPTYYGFGAGSAPIQREAVTQAVADAMRRAGVDATCHQLRHWFGSTLLDAGVDVRTVQSLMRHANLATTERYTHVRVGRRSAGVGALDPFYDDTIAA